MCVVALQLKLLYTTETTDKLRVYGPPRILHGLTNMLETCRTAAANQQSLWMHVLVILT